LIITKSILWLKMLHLEASPFKNIGVIGGGAWGTALAIKCALNDANVTLYCRESELEENINQRQENHLYLPNIKLPINIKATTNLAKLEGCDLLLMAVPAQKIRGFMLANTQFSPSQPVLLCSKGIENSTLKCLSDLVLEFWNVPIMVISGPNFASEVALGKISATTIASEDKLLGLRMTKTLASSNFRVYLSDDIKGVQILAAAKNVIAIAAGISLGLSLGENCKAALITRGLHEACQLLHVFGGKIQTALGLAGIGDLILTATSTTSRNMEFGYRIGQGLAIDAGDSTIEGYYSCKALFELGRKHDLDLPIINSLHGILYEGKQIDKTINDLLSREAKPEFL